MNRRLLGGVALLIGILAGIFLWSQRQPQGVQNASNTYPDFNLAIVSIVEIDPIVELREGFIDSFMNSEFAKNRNVSVKEYNAQGDAGLINQIADQIAVNPPDLVYVLGTPLAQAIQNRVPEVLLVQGAATDPVEAGLADSWEGSGRNYLATSDLPPLERQLDLISELLPDLMKLGVVYNPGEVNSVAVVTRLRSLLDGGTYKFSLEERPVAVTTDVAMVIQSLVGDVEALYIPPDNTVHAAIPVVGEIAYERKLPFFATVESALDDGALATLALNFVQLGRESADLALKALATGEPGTIPIQLTENPQIRIDESTAVHLGIDLSGYNGSAEIRPLTDQK